MLDNGSILLNRMLFIKNSHPLCCFNALIITSRVRSVYRKIPMGVYKQVHKVTLKHCVGDRYRMDEAVDGCRTRTRRKDWRY